MGHVFISYSNKNEAVAKELCAALERSGQGLTCWIACRDIPPGDNWPEAIAKAIGDTQVMIALISQHAYQSKHMARELGRADRDNIPVLPIRLDQFPAEEGPFQYFLENTQWLDLHADDYDVVVKRVCELQMRKARNADPAHTGRTVEGPSAASDRPVQLAHWGGSSTAFSALAQECNSVVLTLVAVTFKRERALAGFDLADSRLLFFAFRLLFYVVLAAAVVHIPAWSAAGVRFTQPAFVVSALAIALVEQLALCLALYGAVRVVGAAPDPQQFVAAYCLLSIFQVMADICLVPVQGAALRVQSAQFDKFLSGSMAVGDALPVADLILLALAGVASIALRVVGLVALFKAFRIRSEVGIARAAAALVGGVALWIVAVLVIVRPFEANLYAPPGRLGQPGQTSQR